MFEPILIPEENQINQFIRNGLKLNGK